MQKLNQSQPHISDPSPDKAIPPEHHNQRVHLWPAFVVFVIIGLLFAFLDERLTLGPSWLMISIVLVVLVPFLFVWYQQRHHLSRILGRGLTVFITIIEASSIVLLVASLPVHNIEGTTLLIDAAILWFSNILIFSLWYWEIDCGGPGWRHFKGYKAVDFIFPQLAAGPEFSNDWHPHYLDYLFLAFNTSTAFSPTDTTVLSRRAKVLMMLQSLMSLIVLAMLAARAINILPTGS